LNAEIRGKQKVDILLTEYASNPVGFAADVLGVSLTPDQQAILNELRDSPEVNVKSSHGQGKTFLAAIAVTWWIFCVGGLGRYYGSHFKAGERTTLGGGSPDSWGE
jgi:hypothetical protein